MNKRIYFNDIFIEWTGSSGQVSQNQEVKKIDIDLKQKSKLKEVLYDFLKGQTSLQLNNNNINITQVLELFKNEFYYIEAAGGFIENQNKFLFIHRQGRWDLPKGKLEKKESTEEAAIRECEEECGIKRLKIIKALPSTFHLYPYKQSYALKKSYWYYMESDFNEELTPQLEESIDEVRWFGREDIKSTVLSDTYFTIRDVVTHALFKP